MSRNTSQSLSEQSDWYEVRVAEANARVLRRTVEANIARVKAAWDRVYISEGESEKELAPAPGRRTAVAQGREMLAESLKTRAALAAYTERLLVPVQRAESAAAALRAKTEKKYAGWKTPDFDLAEMTRMMEETFKPKPVEVARSRSVPLRSPSASPSGRQPKSAFDFLEQQLVVSSPPPVMSGSSSSVS